MKKYKHIETAVIYGGIYGDKFTRAVSTPIYQTSTYEQTGLNENPTWEYSRTGNPTRAALEAMIAELEGGTNGFAFSSGMAAITTILSLFKSGDKIIISSNVYGGTFRVLDKVFKNFKIAYKIVDTKNLQELKSSIDSDVKAILYETPANPLLTISDIAEISKIAKEHNILSIVDNTFMTPYLQRPLSLGADIIIHSATKYLGGHSDLVAGLAVVKDKILAEKIAFLQNAEGAVLGPFDSFLLLRGIKTLALRMNKHVENAEKISKYLERNDAIKNVYYPGLESFEGYELNKKQASAGGGMISFELKENHDIKKFFKSLKLIALAESLGGVESLVCHSASMTHASIPKEIRDSVGITDGLIRLSVGIENVEDLIIDLENAIKESEV